MAPVDVHLHTPMYFFLVNLSFLDISFTTSIVPQLLVNLWGPQKTISYGGCVIQFYISHWLGATECVLLAVMSYDRYAAICRPLHYTVIMHPKLCCSLAFASWLGGLTTSMVGSTLTMLLPLCGNNRIDHFFCEMPLIMQLACVDTSFNEVEMHVASFIFVVLPLGLILVSYSRRNRFKGLDLIDRVPEELCTEVLNIVQETVTKTIPKKKKCKKAKWLSEEALQTAEKRQEVKGKGENPLGLALGSPIFPSGCEGKLGVALESLQGLRDLT